MKTATVADLRNNFARVSKWIEAGEKVSITKRGQPFAILVPAKDERKSVPPWPDLAARMVKPAKGISTEVMDYLRGDF